MLLLRPFDVFLWPFFRTAGLREELLRTFQLHSSQFPTSTWPRRDGAGTKCSNQVSEFLHSSHSCVAKTYDFPSNGSRHLVIICEGMGTILPISAGFPPDLHCKADLKILGKHQKALRSPY